MAGFFDNLHFFKLAIVCLLFLLPWSLLLGMSKANNADVKIESEPIFRFAKQMLSSFIRDGNNIKKAGRIGSLL